MTTLLEIFLVGAIATAIADLWRQALKSVVGLPTTNWGLVGRWVAGFRSAEFHRPAIAGDPAVAGEAAIGWAFHYVVGVIYAAIFIALLDVLGRPLDVIGALVFGLATLAGPWLVLKPALGLGLFARRAAKPWRDFVVTVTTHLAFGLGLYAGARVALAIG